MTTFRNLLIIPLRLLVAASVYVAIGTLARAGSITTLDGDGNCQSMSLGTGSGAEYRTFSGLCNNVGNPDWGSAGVALQRLAPASAYSRDLASLPSTRDVSNTMSAQAQSVPHSGNASAILMQWGQFLDHDLSLSPIGTEEWNIPVDGDDPYFGVLYGTAGMPFARSLRSTDKPDEQVNAITSFIDASQIYGSDASTAAALRVENSYLMKMDSNGLLSKQVDPLTGETVFVSGDERAREQVGLTSMHTLFSREHNRLAKELANTNPGWDDETVYQETRRRVGAMIQSTTFYEFLPTLLGSAAPAAYDSALHAYDSDANATIFNEFSTAAYRFGHTMLNDDLLRLDADGQSLDLGPLPLKEAFFNAEALIDPEPPYGGIGIEPFLRGLAGQRAQEIDTLVVDALRNSLFGPEGFDLPALNMQRGRDHGLPGYVAMRDAMMARDPAFGAASGCSSIDDWDDLECLMDAATIDLLDDVYARVDDIDLWVGGLAENKHADSMLGELFTRILATQFDSLRSGDRFWFEHAGQMDADTIAFVRESTLGDIMRRNGIDGIQTNVFLVPVPGTLALILAGLPGHGRRRRKAMLPCNHGTTSP